MESFCAMARILKSRFRTFEILMILYENDFLIPAHINHCRNHRSIPCGVNLYISGIFFHSVYVVIPHVCNLITVHLCSFMAFMWFKNVQYMYWRILMNFVDRQPKPLTVNTVSSCAHRLPCENHRATVCVPTASQNVMDSAPCGAAKP